jgi:hypothetical protein
MKKVILALVLILALVIPAMAQDLQVLPQTTGISIIDQVKKIPGMKQGIGFSLIENEVNYLTTVELASYKGYALEAGYNSKDKIVAVISADLINLKKLGVTLPVLDLIDIRLGLYGGYGSINSKALGSSEWDAGVSGTVISVKF